MNKKQRKRHDYDYLQQYCEENKIELLEDYSNIKINLKVKIHAKCLSDGCSNEVEKTFKILIKFGCFCKFHTNENGTKKREATNMEKYGYENPFLSEENKRYDYNYLQQYCEENKIKLLEDYSNKKINQKVRIHAKCLSDGCNNEVEKEFKNFIKTCCYCKFHTNENRIEKYKATNMKKRGVEYASQSQEFKDKAKATNLKKRGVEYPAQAPEVKKKMKATNLKKRGVENPMQDAEIAQKNLENSFKKIIYEFPSGRIEEIQGYEPFMLNDLLLEEKIPEEDIFVKRTEVPEIWYEDENDEERRYYIDCYIKSQNKCIEAKSPYTANVNRECMFLKQKAIKDAGYLCEIWVYNAKGEKVEYHK